MIGKAGRFGDGILSSRVLVATIVVAGLILRAHGLFTDFWLDEIWSVALARSARSPIEIFTAIRHDNNHHLNTLWIWLAGAQADWVVYRLFAFAGGIAAMALLPLLGRSPAERVVLALLGAFAAMPVVYSSEARGYAPAAALSVAAVLIFRRGKWPLLFGLVASLSMLAHMTAAFAYLGLLPQKRKGWVLLHLLPIATLAWLASVARNMTLGGGLPMSKLDAAMEAATLTGSIFVIPVALFEIARRSRDEAVFFATAVFVAPAIAVTSFDIPHAHPRYFFIASLFALPLVASFIVRLRSIGVVLIAAWLAWMGFLLAPFLRDGRGHYLAAMELMARESRGLATVSGRYDFGNARTIAFYSPYLPRGRRVEYRSGPSEWFLVHTFNREAVPPNILGYRFVEQFPHGGFSGWTWILYRRDS